MAAMMQLQSRMKEDPGGYEGELQLLWRHFQASLNVMWLPKEGEQDGSKDVGELAMFLAQVTPSYPKLLAAFPGQLLELLNAKSAFFPPGTRRQLSQALILLSNREKLDPADAVPVMLKLLCLSDKVLKKLIFSHLVRKISCMKASQRTKKVQDIVLSSLQAESEVQVKATLKLLFELYKKKVWADQRTANAICRACFHKSSRILIAVLRFLHGYDAQHDDVDDDDEESVTLEAKPLNREDVYKAYHQGTCSSRKRKQAKLQRAMRKVRKLERKKEDTCGSFTPLEQLQDPEGFTEELYRRLDTCREKFRVKLMLVTVISRCIGIHKLVLVKLFEHLQSYIMPRQEHLTRLLVAVVQACHDKVPADAVEPVFMRVVNLFVHNGARSEELALALNFVREVCARIPLVMTEDLLGDLSQYKTFRDKRISSAANSIIALYRRVNPSLLLKKDRGRGTDLQVKPNEFGEAVFSTDVPGIEDIAPGMEDIAEGDEEPETDDGNESNSTDGESEEEPELDGKRQKTEGLLNSMSLRQLRHQLTACNGNKRIRSDESQVTDVEERRKSRPVDPSVLEPRVHQRSSKKQRVERCKAGRVDAVHGARSAFKHKKTGGLSNREKAKKKKLPLAARRSKRSNAARSSRHSSKQFRGKKAWKS